MDRNRGSFRLGILKWCAFACVMLTGAAWAQETEDLEDVLGGFEEDESSFRVEPVDEEEAAARRRWDLSGSLETSGSVNYLSHRSATGTKYTGLQRLRNRLDLQFDYELPREWEFRIEGWAFGDAAYSLNRRDNYTRQVLNEYELDADLGEVWVRGKLHEAVDMKVGRQVVIWGRSETLRVLDILNPLDNREPGRVDLENVRRPLGMLRIDGFAGNWSATVIAITEIRFDLNPVVGSDFYPGIVEPPEEVPDHFEDVELAGAITGIFEGWDISFNAAWFWNDQPRFRRAPTPSILMHDRLWMLGSSGNYTTGGWLLKYEVACLGGIGFFNASDKIRFDALLGVEYYGIENTSIVVEGLNRHLFDYDRALLSAPDFTREDTQEISFRITRDFLNETLHVTAIGVLLGWDVKDGAIIRSDMEYDLLDALEVGVGILIYQNGDLPPLDGWGRNDRVIFNVKWSF